MGELAAELGVSRVTLYRWVGSRDELLVDVLWTLADRAFGYAREQSDGHGCERVVQVVCGFLDLVINNEGMRRFLAEEGELAMRLLTRADRGFQPQLIALVHILLREEADVGELELPVELSEVAFVIVRLIETYTYLDLLTGEAPDPHRADPILRLLLR